MSVKYFIVMLIACAACTGTRAQDRQLVRKGNELYLQNKYREAAEAYRAALQKNPNSMPGMFNLGNALYLGKKTEDARKMMQAAAKNAADKMQKSGAEYNLGNTYMDERKWDEAIDYYKQALRNNPQDADAKYNLSYALAMKKKEEGGGKDKNKDKNKDDKNKDKDKKDKNEKDKDKQNGQDKGQQDKKDQQDQQDKQQPQPRPGKLTEQQADQLLNALQQQEKNRQDKLQKAKGVPVKMEKDW